MLKQEQFFKSENKLGRFKEIGFADTTASMYFQIQDLLLTDLAFLSAMISYKEKGGKSRGGFIIPDPSGMLPSSHLSEEYRYSLSDAQVSGKIQETAVDEKTLSCSHIWREKKPVNS